MLMISLEPWAWSSGIVSFPYRWMVFDKQHHQKDPTTLATLEDLKTQLIIALASPGTIILHWLVHDLVISFIHSVLSDIFDGSTTTFGDRGQLGPDCWINEFAQPAVLTGVAYIQQFLSHLSATQTLLKFPLSVKFPGVFALCRPPFSFFSFS